MALAFDAIVLAGGRSSRMPGQRKPQLPVGNATMLQRVLAAVGRAGTRVVVGPPQPVPDRVVVVQETPPGSGPVSGLAAGTAEITAEIVLVVAADLPFLTPELIEALIDGLTAEADVALLVDENGRDQYLLGAWRSAALRRALGDLDPLPGRAMRELLARLEVARVAVPVPKGSPAPWTDVDTPADLQHARAAGQPGSPPQSPA